MSLTVKKNRIGITGEHRGGLDGGVSKGRSKIRLGEDGGREYRESQFRAAASLE